MKVSHQALFLSLFSSFFFSVARAFKLTWHIHNGPVSKNDGITHKMKAYQHRQTNCHPLPRFGNAPATRLEMIFGLGNDGYDKKTSNDPDVLLKMVEDLTTTLDDVSPELMNKMEKVEMALAIFLEDKSATLRQYDRSKPPPPANPPPMGKLYTNPEMMSNDLMRAEQALEKLRERLRREEEALLRAEQVFQRSLEEQNILRQAEEALQKSRDAAEQRKAGISSKVPQTTAPPPQQKVFAFDRAEGIFRSKGRPTMELGNLFGSSNNASQRQPAADEAPAGVPIIYNWTQGSDGSIKGKVKGSSSFADGATISTSAVALGAEAGTVVTTATGSQYFLEEAAFISPTLQSVQRLNSQNPLSNLRRATLPMFQNNARANQNPTNAKNGQESGRATAPTGVPSIRNWKVRDDGGISGLIYDSSNADDGDYIETSTIAKGQLENGHVVETWSGSRYFLSAESADSMSTNIMNAFKSLSGSNRQSGTITINNKSQTNKEQIRRNTESAMETLENSQSRMTFSLLDLFGANSEPKERQIPPPPPPSPEIIGAPAGIPILSDWTVNGDGSITGYVFGSKKIGDGNLVTTSLIASGERQQFSTVATVSGSVYFLA